MAQPVPVDAYFLTVEPDRTVFSRIQPQQADQRRLPDPARRLWRSSHRRGCGSTVLDLGRAAS
jgi:hypothetical protein